MNKIEVGMYVRTNTGIHKIFEIDEKKTVWKYKCDKKSTGEWDGSYEYTSLKEEQFIGEPSYNITDLIEVGDYVNGNSVLNVIYYEEKLNKEPEIYINNRYISYLTPSNIYSIVTYEQMKSMEYRIGDDDLSK